MTRKNLIILSLILILTLTILFVFKKTFFTYIEKSLKIEINDKLSDKNQDVKEESDVLVKIEEELKNSPYNRENNELYKNTSEILKEYKNNKEAILYVQSKINSIPSRYENTLELRKVASELASLIYDLNYGNLFNESLTKEDKIQSDIVLYNLFSRNAFDHEIITKSKWNESDLMKNTKLFIKDDSYYPEVLKVFIFNYFLLKNHLFVESDKFSSFSRNSSIDEFSAVNYRIILNFNPYITEDFRKILKQDMELLSNSITSIPEKDLYENDFYVSEFFASFFYYFSNYELNKKFNKQMIDNFNLKNASLENNLLGNINNINSISRTTIENIYTHYVSEKNPSEKRKLKLLLDNNIDYYYKVNKEILNNPSQNQDLIQRLSRFVKTANDKNYFGWDKNRSYYFELSKYSPKYKEIMIEYGLKVDN